MALDRLAQIGLRPELLEIGQIESAGVSEVVEDSGADLRRSVARSDHVEVVGRAGAEEGETSEWRSEVTADIQRREADEHAVLANLEQPQTPTFAECPPPRLVPFPRLIDGRALAASEQPFPFFSKWGDGASVANLDYVQIGPPM